jgi:hypothetical protein
VRWGANGALAEVISRAAGWALAKCRFTPDFGGAEGAAVPLVRIVPQVQKTQELPVFAQGTVFGKKDAKKRRPAPSLSGTTAGALISWPQVDGCLAGRIDGNV